MCALKLFIKCYPVADTFLDHLRQFFHTYFLGNLNRLQSARNGSYQI